VFSHEIALYRMDDVDYSAVPLLYHTPVLEVIAIDIFGTLDEQCKLPNPSDRKFLRRLERLYFGITGATGAVAGDGGELTLSSLPTPLAAGAGAGAGAGASAGTGAGAGNDSGASAPVALNLVTPSVSESGASLGAGAAIGLGAVVENTGGVGGTRNIRNVLRFRSGDSLDMQFRVQHYAEEVKYSVLGFLQSHADAAPSVVEALLHKSSSCVFNGESPSHLVQPISTGATAGAAAVGGAAAASLSSVGNNTNVAAANSELSNNNNKGYSSVAAKINAVNSHTAAARLAISTGSQPGSAGPSTGTGAGMVSSAKRGVHMGNNGTMLLQQLSQLMDLVSHSVPHFVRCIKVG
jgi:hypothetical protein